MPDTTPTTDSNPPVADDWLIVTEALEAAGWTGADDNPLEILEKDGAVWAIANDCADSGLSKDGWTVEFPSDTPVSVVVAACLAAVDRDPARLVLGTTDQQPETAPACPQCGDTGACNGGPCPLTETAPDDLRDRVAQALIDWAYRSGDRKYTALRRDETVRANAYSRADAVLAALPAPTDRAAADQPADRRARYAAAITGALPLTNRAIDAVMAVADTERENDRLTLENNSRYIKRLDTEYDSLRAELEAHRLALSDALGLGTGAPWDVIRDRATELNRGAAPTDRAAVLHVAADDIARMAVGAEDPTPDDHVRGYNNAVDHVVTELRRMADEAQQPETEVVEDESCGRFVPDTPRAPGLCASCGDARGWHSLEAVGEQQPEAEAGRLPCSLAFLKRPHTPHTWEPQPGMTPVVCPGADTGPQAKAETEEPTL